MIDGDRLRNGTRARHDGKGDAWANAHREKLEKSFYIQDLDAMFGYMAYAQNTGERLFLEYVPDSYCNAGSAIRQFAVVAMFDRKASHSSMMDGRNAVSKAFYLHLCRLMSQHQPRPARFFYVVGGSSPPWTMHEVDIGTGELCGLSTTITNTSDWTGIWSAIGLSQSRQILKEWNETSS